MFNFGIFYEQKGQTIWCHEIILSLGDTMLSVNSYHLHKWMVAYPLRFC